MIDKILEPISLVGNKLWMLLNGQYRAETVSVGYDEIDNILKEFDDIGLILQENITALRDEKNKLDYILNSIADGLFLLDEYREIILINSAAREIFNVTPDILGKNLNYLVNEKRFISTVEDCASYNASEDTAKNALFEITINGSIYLVTVKRLPGTKLTMVVLTNVTENRENAKRREEFFANASHELKTPLTAIMGFNDLVAINNKDENIRKYVDSITRETERMLSLIADMLKLSELQNTREIKPEPVSIAKTVNEAREALSTAIDEKSIIFSVTGDAVITAEPGHIYELVKNLVENAIRYNNEKGSVTVSIENKKNAPQLPSPAELKITDNGIGISPEEQSRIFERFYRGEKSRSTRNGGTGLGLSIVKHICALYDWKLSLKSKLGIGTEVLVIFKESSED
jgi:two-component system phosphate regulon sensor histidine kinase PhoR